MINNFNNSPCIILQYKLQLLQFSSMKFSELLKHTGYVIHNKEYRHYYMCVHVQREEIEKIPVEKDVRQGCVLSPTYMFLFVYTGPLHNSEGEHVREEIISDIRYAENTAI